MRLLTPEDYLRFDYAEPDYRYQYDAGSQRFGELYLPTAAQNASCRHPDSWRLLPRDVRFASAGRAGEGVDGRRTGGMEHRVSAGGQTAATSPTCSWMWRPRRIHCGILPGDTSWT